MPRETQVIHRWVAPVQKMCLKARSKADLEQYYNNLADEVEEGLKHNNISSVFRSVQAKAGSPTQSH